MEHTYESMPIYNCKKRPKYCNMLDKKLNTAICEKNGTYL